MRHLLALTILLICFSPVTSMKAFAVQQTTAKQALVMDFETGQVLLSKNADEKMPTSSMSKVMTMYMVFDALKRGVITPETEFTVSEEAWRKGGSKMFVPLGKMIKVKDLMRGVIIQSGNDATIVLAEGLAGSEEAFAKAMTAKALEMGMEDSNFVNASGWPDPNHYSTAHDLAIMARAMIENFPDYFKLFSETEFTFSNIKQMNRNPLLYRKIGADGLKTGHTEAAGYGLIGTAVQDGRRVLMVVNGLASEQDRADEGSRLITWALNGFTNIDIAKAGKIVANANVSMGKSQTVPMVLNQDIKITMPKLAVDKYKADVTYNAPLIAPITKGQEIGTMTIHAGDMDPLTYPLFAGEDVARVGFFKQTLNKLSYLIIGKL